MALTVKQWRLAKEISQEQMANKLNVHVNTYINWERKPENISIKYAVLICEVLGVPISDVSFLSSTLQNVELKEADI